ncbi:MAG: hypothetical protein QOG21_2157 [Actinomycetota bacterium]|nr:hypothetical protein [Actinomycetota bacterium]
MFKARTNQLLLASLIVVAILLGLFVVSRSAQAGPKLVTSRDGLRLYLGRTGAVDGVRERGIDLPMLAHRHGGLSIRLAGGQPNLLANPSFEKDADGDGIPDGWSLSSSGGVRLVNDVHHSGNNSIEISSATVATTGAASRFLSVRPDHNYTLSVWLKTHAVQPTAPTAETPTALSPVRVKVQQYRGKTPVVSKTVNVMGYTNTTGWNRQFGGFRTAPRVNRVKVSALLVNGSGTVWVDDLRVRALLGAEIYRAGVVRAGDAQTLHETTHYPSHIQLSANYAHESNHISVKGRVRTDGSKDRAVQVSYTIPIDARGWRWPDYVRAARTISGHRQYSNLTRWNLQQMSRYPFGGVYNKRIALAMGLPLANPRLARISYDANSGLTVTFDLALSPQTGHKAASFAFSIYQSAPQWGFRAMSAKYYGVYPQAFVRRTDIHHAGIWFSQPDSSSLDDPATAEDESSVYGLGMDMIALGRWRDQSNSASATDFVVWDDQHNAYSLAYNHHWLFYHPTAAGALPTYQQEVAQLRDLASGSAGNSTQSADEARAALISTARDVNGRLLYEIYRNQVALYQDPSAIRSGNWSWATQRYQVLKALRLAASSSGKLDGIHMDSVSGMRRWGAAEDYERAHWKNTGFPLSFSYNSGRAEAPVVLADASHLRDVADFLHSRGLILSANFNGSDARSGAYFSANVIDLFGIEQTLEPKTGVQDPFTNVDRFAMAKRTLADTRPVSVLNLDLTKAGMTVADFERIMQQHLFYDFLVGAFGNDLATGPASQPAYRAVYAKYTPIFKQLAVAGWQPVTWARSSDRQVWLERYGSLARHDLRLTVWNGTQEVRPYTARLNLIALGGCRAGSVSARDEVSGQTFPVSVRSSGRRASVQATIPANSVQVLHIRAQPRSC